MKISKLHIDSYKHLENLSFDFTYQSGDRKGQPLDKICFIGQSASGKTNLLELIFEYVQFSFGLELIDGKYLSSFMGGFKKMPGEICLSIKNEYYSHKNDIVSYRGRDHKYNNVGGSVSAFIDYKDTGQLYFYKSNLISEQNIDLFSKNPIDLIEKYSTEIDRIKSKSGKLYEIREIVFNDKVEETTWIHLISEILDYRKNFTRKMSELIHKGLLANAKKLSAEFEKWQKENPNKLEEFAEKFNPILEKLNLEVDIIDTEYSIPIKNKRSDEIIPIQNTSTGTKGLLLSFLPLYKLDTKDSIILIDEPERSLYPDMQMDLMEYYKNFAPEAQFIVATHSPFIAASFEPDERFILEFDEQGKVTVRRGSSPIGDDPNDMLKNDFNVNYYNKHGEEAYQKYINLKQEVAKENNPKRKKELLLETVKLGDTYNF
ncbi:AAA family ATPase [Flavobacterium sp. NST-5]|uniref:AAA family ATPase n=1 Tax=Flavobacterium ichthyis TaxID=2698827 RepID=A0ABW9Z9W9_9FLAO|nr:ATP-binding protein [Flavobacterium ichthyis]NBL63598.1 AAA family ATPase [Flavobacterium ichthyis]